MPIVKVKQNYQITVPVEIRKQCIGQYDGRHTFDW